MDGASPPITPSSPDDGEGNYFACNICLDTASDPVLTLCGHLYCWPCIYQWMEARGVQASCPVCKVQLSEERILPVYGRGRTPRASDPRPHVSSPESHRSSEPWSSCAGCISSAGLGPTAAHYRNHPHASPPRPAAATSPRCASGSPPSSPTRLPSATATAFSSDELAPLAIIDGGSYNASNGFLPPNNSVLGGFHGLLALMGIHLTPLGPGSSQEVAAVAALSPEQAQQAYLSRLLLLLGSFVILCLLLI